MTLIFPYYIPDDTHRHSEILACLQSNINNDRINNIIIATDATPDVHLNSLLNSKCVLWNIERRLTYSMVFDYINNNIDHGELCILCNSDIFFDDSVSHLNELPSDMFVCLTRYDVHADGVVQFMNRDFMMRSQDTWAFRSPLPEKMVLDSDFHMGVNGCDNRIAYVASEHYVVTNPSFIVKTYHLHNTPYRTYSKLTGLSGTYMYVWPTDSIAPSHVEEHIVQW